MEWLLSIIFFFIGYKLQAIESAIKVTKTKLEAKKDKPVMTTNDTAIIDPFDPLQQAKYEHLQMMKRLNGDDYEE